MAIQESNKALGVAVENATANSLHPRFTDLLGLAETIMDLSYKLYKDTHSKHEKFFGGAPDNLPEDKVSSDDGYLAGMESTLRQVLSNIEATLGIVNDL